MTRVRKHLFVDPKVQGALIVRVVLYWAVCLIGITLMLLAWQTITGPPELLYSRLRELWFSYGPALIASLILLPLVIVDIVRMSNRFVGPLVRLRRSMRELARGEQVRAIAFRDGDFWLDFADEFNALRDRMEALTSLPKADHQQPDEDEVVGIS
jgi:hypothetical protein